ncbi:hypothetical protein [Oryzibacter oryziterrae]|uniref:hypothetical protein n=1 Tax=Oryzibacter oryziterrae TaxID=2766474 RepID=UPI001F29AB80|nr:hypothetical protein [Oryzibacter oryziterrae]
MNKVVTLEMLASELPEKVRGAIASDHRVEVSVRDLGVEKDQPLRKGKGVFSRHFDIHFQNFSSTDDVLDHIRAIRDGEDGSQE